MARPKGSTNKPKTPKTAKAKPEAAPEAQATASVGSASGFSASFKKPSKDEVKRLVNRLEGYKADQKQIGDTAKEALDKAVETKHFDRTALGMVRTLFRMGKKKPEKLAITLPHLLSMIDDLELDKIADAHAGMDLDGEPDDDAPQGQTDQPNPMVGGLKIVPKGDDESDVPAAPAAA
jgi:hypothetical protein